MRATPLWKSLEELEELPPRAKWKRQAMRGKDLRRCTPGAAERGNRGALEESSWNNRARVVAGARHSCRPCSPGDAARWDATQRCASRAAQ